MPQATQEEMREATKAAASAFKTWKQTTPLTRQRLMLDLQLAIRDQTESLAASITKEQGKTLVDARGDVLRGLRTHKFRTLEQWGDGTRASVHVRNTRALALARRGNTCFGARVCIPVHVGSTRALGHASAFPRMSPPALLILAHPLRRSFVSLRGG